MPLIGFAEPEKESPHEVDPEKAPHQAPAARMTTLLAFSIVVLFALIIVAGIILILS